MHAVSPPPLQPDSAESVRREHLSHEASVRSIGLLFYMAAAIILVAVAPLIFAGHQTTVPARIGASLLLLAFVPLYVWIGMGLRRLDPRVRLGATLLAAIGLLSIPIGTLINGYILYLLHSARGKRVFSEEYRAVMAATPHIRYRTSRVVIGLAILLVVLLAVLVVAALSGP